MSVKSLLDKIFVLLILYSYSIISVSGKSMSESINPGDIHSEWITPLQSEHFHSSCMVPVADRPLIDHVLVNKNVTVDRYGILSEKKDGIYLSDHNPVFVHVNIK